MINRRIWLGLPVILVAGPASAQPAMPAGLLPQDLSVAGMVQHAGTIVQAVMGSLLLASLITWTVLIAKGIELLAAQRRVRRAVRAAETDGTIVALQQRFIEQQAKNPVLAMIDGTVAELRVSRTLDPAATRDRIAARLKRIEAAAGRRMGRGTGVLATIGATAPFVGLFGTVWGIMNSFVGIAQTHTTNLAVVAPGIAEALLATATGLVAAIPAVVIYNLFARGIGAYRAALGDLSAVIQLQASRELDAPHAFRAAAE